MKEFFLYLLFFSVWFSSHNAQKFGCRSYEKTGEVVAGDGGENSLLNKFITDRFYVDDTGNIYLMDRTSSNKCSSYSLLWSTKSSKGKLITDGSISDESLPCQDMLVSPNGQYNFTKLNFNEYLITEIRHVDGQNGFMVGERAIVDNDKNIYILIQSCGRVALRKWPPDQDIFQGGISIDFQSSSLGISDFFVDNNRSVYI